MQINLAKVEFKTLEGTATTLDSFVDEYLLVIFLRHLA